MVVAGTWEGDQSSGNDANGASGGNRFVTTIIESGSPYTTTFIPFREEHMECSDPQGDADQSVQFFDGTYQYVSFEQCQAGCEADDSCNGLIEYGTGICDSSNQHIDSMTGRAQCTDWHQPGRCVAENLCTCYLVRSSLRCSLFHFLPEAYLIRNVFDR